MRFAFFVSLALVPGCGFMLDPVPDAGFDAATADAGGGVACGATVCAPGLECCNPSCGVCTAPGAGCPAIECVDAGRGDDGGGVDASRPDGGSDAGSSDGGAVVICGGETCEAGQHCCTDCDGASACTTGPCLATPCPTPCTSTSGCAATDYCDLRMGGCAGLGTCAPRPTACTDDCPGVCGCDGVTYCNECDANAMGQTVASNTPCARTRGCLPMQAVSVGECAVVLGYAWDGYQCQQVDCICSGADCGRLYPSAESCQTAYDTCVCGGFLGRMCPPGAYCDYPPDSMCGAGDANGACRVPPMGCVDVFAPVCGCDGRTHSNACEASAASTSVAHVGACAISSP